MFSNTAGKVENEENTWKRKEKKKIRDENTTSIGIG